MFDLKEILTASLILFAVIDILGSVPLIIYTYVKRWGIFNPKKPQFIATVIMIGFLFLGEEILKLIGIDVNSFAVAGAFSDFISSLRNDSRNNTFSRTLKLLRLHQLFLLLFQ